MSTPFATAVTGYAGLSASLSDVSGSLRYPSGSGKFNNALTERIAKYQSHIASLSDAADQVSGISEDQGHADTVFSAHPNRADVRAQEQTYKQAQESGNRAWEEAERDRTNEIRATFEAKKQAHAGDSGTSESALCSVDVPSGDFSGRGLDRPASAGGEDQDAHPSTPLPGTVDGEPSASAPSDSTSDATSAVSDTDAGTALSSDTDTATRTPSLYSGPAQPSMSPMTPQQLAGQQGAPVTGAPVTGGVPTAQSSGTPSSRTKGTALSDPSRAARDAERARRARDNDRKRYGDNNTSDATPPVVAPIDRGSSTSNVTTTRDVSGSAKTALSGNTANLTSAGNGVTSTNPARGPIGPMGGAGGMGAGASLSNGKERPNILSSDPQQLGYDKDGIKSGTVGRDSASVPDIDEYRAERETGNSKRDKGNR